MATIGRKSARRAGQNAHNGALDDRKVRRNSLLRSFERTEGPNPREKGGNRDEMRGQTGKARFWCVFRHSWGRGSASTLPHFWASLG